MFTNTSSCSNSMVALKLFVVVHEANGVLPMCNRIEVVPLHVTPMNGAVVLNYGVATNG